jgi:hypothetical protein
MSSFYEHHRDSIRWQYRCFDRILLNGLIQPFQEPTTTCASPTLPAEIPSPPRNSTRASSPRSAARPNATPSPRSIKTWQNSAPKGSLPSFPTLAAINSCRAATQSAWSS